MSYKIGSFNVRNLSYAAGKSRDLDMIADIIREFDIVALQEVLSEGKILQGYSLKDVSGQAMAYEYSLKSRLGDNWDMCWLDPKTESKWYPYLGNDLRGEGYAFIWRKDKFSCPRRSNGTVIYPRIIHQYKTDSTKGEMKLIRNPGYGRFQVLSMPNAEIRLINIHIVYNKPNAENLSKTIDDGAYSMRKKEFNVLARSIYTRISENHNDINCVVPYTIILGDYNLNLKESGAGSPYVPSITVIDEKNNIIDTTGLFAENGFYVLHTKQEGFSTINRNADGYVSNYDHFTYDERTRNSVVQGTPRRIDAVKRAGDYKTYKDKVSDHIPVLLEIDFK